MTRAVAWVGFVCATALVIAPTRARAQAAAGDGSAERAAIHTQLDIATGLYVASAVLAVGGIVALPVGVIGIFSASTGDETRALFALFIAGAVALPLALLVLSFAIGLHVDAETRRGRLDREAARVSLGLGEVGISLRVLLL